MVGATRRVARYRAARRAAPTFRNDEVAAQRRRWTFYETITFLDLHYAAPKFSGSMIRPGEMEAFSTI
jgi:hypothetical protein